MSSSIEEFSSKKRDENYYHTVVKELSKLNEEFHAFNNINESVSEGFPFSVKDNICVKGVETTASSRILKGYLPPFDATTVVKLKEKGFGFLGKTNMDEFGFGTFGINNEHQVRNPFNKEYVAGGSSAGAAVATALLKYHVALAESTGGSIATPASFCGVVGFTPTYGLTSRYGLIDYANSLDKIGVITRSASDARKAFDIIKGPDRYDTTSLDAKVTDEKKKKVYIIDQLMKHVDEKITSVFSRFTSKLEGKGYKVEHVSVEEIEKAVQVYYIISSAETSTNLAKYTGFKYGFQYGDYTKNYNEFFTNSRAEFGKEAKRRVILGTFVRSASVRNRYYDRSLKARSLFIKKISNLLKDGYVINPTMPMQTPKIKEVSRLSPVEIYAMDIMTVPANLCGFPHASFPIDYINDMPVGAMVMTNHFNDYAALDFVDSWEKDFAYKFRYNVGSL
jgi:aspartyl-tRNA(Asn)/glutamyl-tRNA(Gln) amidotransferase subunit A